MVLVRCESCNQLFGYILRCFLRLGAKIAAFPPISFRVKDFDYVIPIVLLFDAHRIVTRDEVIDSFFHSLSLRLILSLVIIFIVDHLDVLIKHETRGK